MYVMMAWGKMLGVLHSDKYRMATLQAIGDLRISDSLYICLRVKLFLVKLSF